MVNSAGIALIVVLAVALVAVIIVAVIFGMQEDYFKKKRCFSKELYETIPEPKRSKWIKIYHSLKKKLVCRPGQPESTDT